jgi:hypothetical protein
MADLSNIDTLWTGLLITPIGLAALTSLAPITPRTLEPSFRGGAIVFSVCFMHHFELVLVYLNNLARQTEWS